MLKIENDGQRIVSTDYWTTPHAAAGKLYLSINAGAFRLLVPQSMESEIAEMRTGKTIVISYGTDEQTGQRGYELLFDDGSDSPYSLFTNNADRAVLETRRDKLPLLVYTRAGLAAQFEAHFRRVDLLPCLEPWDPKAS